MNVNRCLLGSFTGLSGTGLGFVLCPLFSAKTTKLTTGKHVCNILNSEKEYSEVTNKPIHSTEEGKLNYDC